MKKIIFSIAAGAVAVAIAVAVAVAAQFNSATELHASACRLHLNAVERFCTNHSHKPEGAAECAQFKKTPTYVKCESHKLRGSQEKT